MRVGVPGLRTTAYLTLKLYEPRIVPVVIAFDKILDAVRSGTVEAGLLIHEGQLLFPQLGLHRVVDLGQWWLEQTGLPLPLGGNAIRRALGVKTGRQVAKAIRDSVTLFAGASRRGAELRDAVRARHGSRTRRQIYRDVRQQVDARLRRTRAQSRA